MLLVLNVVYDKHIPAKVARDLHRSRQWGLYWLDRFLQEGVEGLKKRPKSGRYPDISEEKISEIKKELASCKQGWTTNQVEDLIVRKSGINIVIHMFTDSCTNGDSNRRYLEKHM